jgi:hypothetical protein
MNVPATRRRRLIWGTVLSLFCLILGVDANQTVPTGNLAAHWHFDSIVTPAPDVSGHGNNLTLLNTPTAATAGGLFGGGLHFTAASLERGTAVSNTSFDVSTGLTVGVWVKPTGLGVMRVMNKWDAATAGGKGWHLDINAGVGGATVAGNVRLRVRDGVVDSDYFAAGALGQGAWHHIAGVYDFTAKTAKLFVDGKQVGVTKATGTLSAAGVNNTTAVGIAAMATGTLTPYFNGDMDEPVIYTRALSDPELTTLGCRPQGLTASTGQISQVTLNWGAVAGAANYSVMRSTTHNGPYSLVTYVTAPATTYVDTSATAGTYYYVIKANFTTGGGFSSKDSDEAVGTSLPPVVTALPNLGLFTNEAGLTTTFDLKINRTIPAGTTVTLNVTSGDPSEGWVKDSTHAFASTISIPILGPQVSGLTIPIDVKGQPDLIADGPITYNVTVTTSSTDATFDKLVIPPVQVTNNDDDTAGITFTKTMGLTTNESGGTATLSVVLDTAPVGIIDLTLASSNTLEGMVSPTTITFDNTNWNVPRLITLTGVDDGLLDFSVPYTVVGALTTHHAGDAAYNSVIPPILSAVNLDNEVVPEPPHAWGGSDNGGGCGLTGLDAVALLALASLARRRRRA